MESKHPVSVRPVKDKSCTFEVGTDPSGKRKLCPSQATIQLDEHALCDRHAEYQMASICGRGVKIERGTHDAE